MPPGAGRSSIRDAGLEIIGAEIVKRIAPRHTWNEMLRETTDCRQCCEPRSVSGQTMIVVQPVIEAVVAEV